MFVSQALAMCAAADDSAQSDCFSLLTECTNSYSQKIVTKKSLSEYHACVQDIDCSSSEEASEAQANMLKAIAGNFENYKRGDDSSNVEGLMLEADEKSRLSEIIFDS
ncbi:hypothetical protein PoB_000772900 [Plakobranchus ocellatus]|uniref:Uncharacterized protein n=1 Tax=Plakobranchus ocellatus TaxID=259542 RepID=A0AAV3YE00_9GAST|nr:hypothetical protein PoB_000772900 [Plakobranchus ocellatus]